MQFEWPLLFWDLLQLVIQWERNYCMCSIKTRERKFQCWDAATASGDQQRDAGVLGRTERQLLISCFFLIVSRPPEAHWPPGGPWRGGEQRPPSAGRDNVGFLLPSMKALRGLTPAMLVNLCCFSLPLDCSLRGRCACHADATACPCWPTELVE